MAAVEPYLPHIWIGLIAFFLLYYTAVDGVILGVGMLSLTVADPADRKVMMGSVLSTWHGNQTWLMIVGGMMFGAFPLFYGLVLTALYIPFVVMVLGFAIRGVALDYWEEAERKRPWELAFGLGSLLTTLAQGFALGGLLGGINVERDQFVGSLFDWVSPFTAFATLGVIFGYLMLGANFMIMKMEGKLQERGRRWALTSALFTLASSIGVYGWLLANNERMAERFSSLPEAWYVLPFPVLAVFCFLALLYCLRKRYESAPLFLNVATIILSFGGISVGIYPDMIPNVISKAVTVEEAAAAPETLIFMLLVVGVLIPFILIYTSYVFWVFRGKVSDYYEKD